MKELQIDKNSAGGRLDKAVMKYLSKAPAGFIYKMLRKKNIVLNGKRAKGDELLQNGDVITLFFAEDTIRKFSSDHKDPETTEIPENYILYEDEQILAMNKPAGMLSQKASAKDRSLNDLLQAYLPSGELFTPGISNRLDRNTSGIVLAGKTPNAVRCLNTAIARRDLEKYYLCIVKGRVQEDRNLRGYIRKDSVSNTVQVLEKVPSGKEKQYSFIETSYSPVSCSDMLSLLKVDLITGRSHQIRAHLASVGHPILGDPKYGDETLNRNYHKLYGISGQMLHAWCIRFVSMGGVLSYLNGKTMICPVPEKFEQCLKGEKLCLHGGPEDSEVLNLKQL